MRFALITIAMLLPWIWGCGDGDSQLAYSLPDTYQGTEQIRYKVEGGGEIDFTIKRLSGSYQVDVTRYGYATSSESFVVTEAELDIDVSQLLESLFRGSVNLGGVIYTSEAPTGSWTYVYVFHDGAWLRIANVAVIEGMKSVHDLVISRMP